MQVQRIRSCSPQSEMRASAHDNARHLRHLSHELSNALDTVLQASYLLEQSKLSAGARNWIKMISNSAQDAAAHNREIREVLRRVLPAPEEHLSGTQKPNLQLVEKKDRKSHPRAESSSSQRGKRPDAARRKDAKRQSAENTEKK